MQAEKYFRPFLSVVALHASPHHSSFASTSLSSSSTANASVLTGVCPIATPFPGVPTSTLFPQVSRGESNDAAKGLLDDAGDSSGDEAHYAPRGDYAPPRPVTSPPVTTQPSGELNQCAIVGGEEVSFVEISPDRPRLRASVSSGGDAPPRRPIASHRGDCRAVTCGVSCRLCTGD